MKHTMLKMWQNALTSMLKKVIKWKTRLFGINLLTKNKQSWAKILKKQDMSEGLRELSKQ